jgi:amino acid adenylation domain-containing protein
MTEALLPARPDPDHAAEEIAIVGMAGRFPGARDVDELWRNLRDGVESISRFTADELAEAGIPPASLADPAYVRAAGVLDGADEFDAAFFGYTPRAAEVMDPQQRVLLECAWSALEHAGVDPRRFRGAIGVYAGASSNGYLENVRSRPEVLEQVGHLQAEMGSSRDVVATLLSYRLDLRGPSFTVQSACSTSLVATHLACQALLNRECDLALAGGVSVRVPLRAGYFYREGSINSPDGRCRAFDARAQGMVGGSGVAMVVLKRLADALEDGDTIHAVIRGTAVNNDGARKAGFTAPGEDGQARAVAEAISVAGVHPDSIGYVEAHGTGTALGDPVEVAALNRAFRARGGGAAPCAIGSVKSNLGHLDAAAGVTGLIKAALALRHRQLPPSLHFTAPNPLIDFAGGPFRVNAALAEWASAGPRRAGVSSFGIGGTNAHAVLEEAPPRGHAPGPRPFHLLTLSARTPAALREMASRLAAHLEAAPSTDLADAAYTLQVGRAAFPHRRALAAASAEDAAAKLRAGFAEPAAAPDARPVAFLFPGQGSQYPGMGRELYATERAFRREVDRCAEILLPLLGADLREVVYPQDGSTDAAGRLKDTRLAQPALFVVEYALARLWMSWGIKPAAMLGHSIGEYVAATLAGVFTLEDALALVAERGRRMAALPRGSMLAVPLAEAGLLPRLDGGLCIAAVNTPSRCVVSGPADEVDALAARLEAEGVACRALHTSHAFHSAMMEPAVAPFVERVRGVRLSPPAIPFVSNLTGTWITAAEATDPAYWGRHLRGAVRFADGVAALFSEDGLALLEVGPGRTLGKLAKQHPGRPAGAAVLASLPDAAEARSGAELAASALGELWAAGASVDWSAYHRGERRGRIPLPTYPFERRRYWIEHAQAEASRAAYRANRTAPSLPQDTMQTPTLSPAAPPMDRALALLTPIFAGVLGVAPGTLDADAELLELGVDSLLLIQASQQIQARTGIRIAFRLLLEELSTLRRLAAYLEDHLPVLPETPAPAPEPAAAAAPVAAPAIATPAPPAAPAGPTAAADTAVSGGLARVIDQQLRLMAQQLEILRGGASPATATPPVAAAAAPARAAHEAAPAPEPAGGGKTADGKLDVQAFVRFSPVRAGKEELAPGQRAYLDDFMARYVARTPESKRLSALHRPHLADNRVILGFRTLWKEMVYPIVGRRSSGSRLWDVDGNEYVDFMMGFGVNLFGHSPGFITDAVAAQLGRGVQIGAQAELAGEVARLVCELTGMERAAFCNTGSDAVMTAVRVARSVSGRDKVAMFNGSYHGSFDGLLGRGRGGGELRAVPLGPGQTESLVGDLWVLDYDDPRSLEILRERGHELAAVLVEPVHSRRPDIQPRAFLQELRKVTEETGTALVFDDTVLGFRVHPAGSQGVFGVRADLATYGKVVGGGMPIGVLAGSGDYLDALDGGEWSFGDDSYPRAEQTFFAGTFNKHPLAMAAAHAVLSRLQAEGPALQEGLAVRTDAMVERLNGVFDAAGVPMKAANFKSLFTIMAGRMVKHLDLFPFHLIQNGIFVWQGRTYFLSTAHSDADVDAFVGAVEASVAQLQEGGFLPGRPGGGGIPAAAAPAGEIVVPLTEAQRELWLTAQLGDAASVAYNHAVTLDFRGPLDRGALQRAVDGVVARHEALRTTFPAGGEEQRIAPALSVEIAFDDLAALDPAERESRAAEIAAAAVQEPFDLERGPLLRLRLLKLDGDRHRLAVAMHHLAVDGWSLGVVMAELGALYSAEAGGPQRTLPPPARFSEHARRMHAARANAPADEAFWTAALDGARPLEVPAAKPRPSARSFAGARTSFTLGRDLSDAVRRLSARVGATPAATLLGAFTALLHRLSGEADGVVGMPSAGQLASGDAALVGHCVHLLPIRTRVGGETTFARHVAAVRGALLDAYDHQGVSFAQIVNALRLPRDPARPPLVSVTFNLERNAAPAGSGDERPFHGLETTASSRPPRAEAFDLGVDVVELPGGMHVEVAYATDLYDEAAVARLVAGFEALLRAAAADPDAAVAGLPVMDDAGRDRVLREWAGAPAAAPDATLHGGFEAQAAATPDAVAVVTAERPMRFRELDGAANRIAHALLRHGVRAEERVGVCVADPAGSVAALLGVLKAGAAYLPLDPALPRERIARLLADAGARLVVSEAGPRAILPDDAVTVAVDGAEVAAESDASPDLSAAPDQLAYVIYTSGSTGAPKGVGVSHRAAAAHLARAGEALGLGAGDRVLRFAGTGFDVAVEQTLAVLLRGGAVVPRGAELWPAADFFARVAALGVTVADLPPAYLATLLAETDGAPADTPLRLAVSGGEALPGDTVRRWREAMPRIRLVNAYGPTEAVITATLHELSADEGAAAAAAAPLGRPLAGRRAVVLDARMQPVPAGAPGELYLGGPLLARGYLGDARRTAAAFLPDPFAADPGARLYRSGDRVRWRADGVLEFLGRVDEQVKVRGFRIEPGEVEAALRAHPSVREAAVAAHGAGAGTRLAAWFVADGAAPEPAELRAHLRRTLPEYMVPSAFVALDALPLASSGKVDRRALPAPPAAAPADTVEPRTETEQAVAAAWRELLSVARVGVEDDFFALGGHSLLATRVLSRLRDAYGVEMTLADFFAAPTVASLAAEVERRRGESSPEPAITALPRDGRRGRATANGGVR